MPPIGISPRSVPHKPVPRGIATSGPAILSYGFRPFFFCAGTYAALAMVLWIGAYTFVYGIFLVLLGFRLRRHRHQGRRSAVRGSA